MTENPVKAGVVLTRGRHASTGLGGRPPIPVLRFIWRDQTRISSKGACSAPQPTLRRGPHRPAGDSPLRDNRGSQWPDSASPRFVDFFSKGDQGEEAEGREARNYPRQSIAEKPKKKVFSPDFYSI